ncbi:hypothetical protein C0J52_13134, partial [Blattella germanica]
NVLLKIPCIPGHECSREVATQTTDQADFIQAANVPPEHLGPLVEACVFAQTPDGLSWVDEEERGLKGEISAGFKALGTTTDIIVACHPATLAAITSHSFVATPIAEIQHPVSADSMLLKPCIESNRECSPADDGGGSPTESLPESESIVTDAVDKSTAASTNYINSPTENVASLENVTVMDLKPFITSGSNNGIPSSLKVEFGSAGQEMESLVLDSYEQDRSNDCDPPSTNVMHIVVASTAVPPVGDPEAPIVVEQVVEKVEENSKLTKRGDHYVCEVCERTFRSACSLEIHLSRFASVQGLQEHCRTEHGGKGCFNCAVCGKRFMTKLSFRRHMDTHGGKKGAVCDTHTGIKEHVCDMCNKAFSRGDKLKDHMLRHLNIKRYHCTLCKRDYAEKRDLTKHLKVHMT